MASGCRRALPLQSLYTDANQAVLRQQLTQLTSQIDLLQRSQNTAATQLDGLLKERSGALYDLLDALDTARYSDVDSSADAYLLAQNKLWITTGDTAGFADQIALLAQQAQTVQAQLGNPQSSRRRRTDGRTVRTVGRRTSYVVGVRTDGRTTTYRTYRTVPYRYRTGTVPVYRTVPYRYRTGTVPDRYRTVGTGSVGRYGTYGLRNGFRVTVRGSRVGTGTNGPGTLRVRTGTSYGPEPEPEPVKRYR